MTPERQAAEAIDRASMIGDVRFSITGQEAVEAISGAGLVVMTAEKAAQLLEAKSAVLPNLDAMEAAARAATPGPWWLNGGEVWTHADVPGSSAVVFDCREADAAFIAALHPGAALALIARVRRAEAALREIVADCEADYPPSHGAIKHAARAALEGRSDV